jgi:hypothetical protein
VKCWAAEPTARPEFAEIVTILRLQEEENGMISSLTTQTTQKTVAKAPIIGTYL